MSDTTEIPIPEMRTVVLTPQEWEAIGVAIDEGVKARGLQLAIALVPIVQKLQAQLQKP